MLEYGVPLGLLNSIHESRYVGVTAYRGKLEQLYVVRSTTLTFFSLF
jgi:hypothetical protein